MTWLKSAQTGPLTDQGHRWTSPPEVAIVFKAVLPTFFWHGVENVLPTLFWHGFHNVLPTFFWYGSIQDVLPTSFCHGVHHAVLPTIFWHGALSSCIYLSRSDAWHRDGMLIVMMDSGIVK